MANPITLTAIRQRMLVAQTLSDEQEAVITSLANSVLAVMESRLGRRLSPHDYTEAYDGNGRRTLYLQHDPINAVSSVSLDGTALTIAPATPAYPYTHDVDILDGMALRLVNGNVWTPAFSNVIVTYNAGWVSPPVDLIDAGCLWTVAQFQTGRRFPTTSDRASSLDDAASTPMPKYVEHAIETHKRDALWGW